MYQHLHQDLKPNWPLALVQKALGAIKVIVFSSDRVRPFTLSLSKRRARLRQAQPERVLRVDARQVISVSHSGDGA
jgi:hypothetical protein